MKKILERMRALRAAGRYSGLTLDDARHAVGPTYSEDAVREMLTQLARENVIMRRKNLGGVSVWELPNEELRERE